MTSSRVALVDSPADTISGPGKKSSARAKPSRLTSTSATSCSTLVDSMLARVIPEEEDPVSGLDNQMNGTLERVLFGTLPEAKSENFGSLYHAVKLKKVQV